MLCTSTEVMGTSGAHTVCTESTEIYTENNGKTHHINAAQTAKPKQLHTNISPTVGHQQPVV